MEAETIEFPSEAFGLPVREIGDYCCYYEDEYVPYTNLKTVIIPESITTIGEAAFAHCPSLENVTIPDSVTEIGKWAFRECTNLKSITIPGGVKYINYGAFWDCTALQSLIIEEGVETIGPAAFAGCKGIIDVTIPDGVIEIGDWAFEICFSLENITIPETVLTLGKSVFYGCYNINSIDVAENNPNYCSVDGVLYSKDKTELIHYPAGKSEGEYVVDESITVISESAFCATNFDSITIENPDCEILGDEDTISTDADENGNVYYNGVIYGLEGSTAQAYAEKYGYKFALIGEEYVVPKGDLSDNGTIDLYDAIEVAKAVMGMRTLTAEEEEIADFNGDGVVDLYDVIDIAIEIMK